MAPLDPDGDASALCEVWGTDGELVHGRRNGLHYGHNDEIVFGALQLEEAAFDRDAARTGKTPLQCAAEHAYREIFGLTEALDFPNILRFWNYIGDINGHSHGMERYRQFNMGRQDGFLGSGRRVTGSVPAASALGFSDGPLTIYFLAARSLMPVPIENPRQVSAYQYPQQYGPRSPTFSRASVMRVGGDQVLFVSGTASIVGHQTLHLGDVVAQTRETVANIAAVLEEAKRVVPDTRFTLNDLCYKVYVRHEKDVAVIHAELRRSLGAAARLLFLRADICREELLVEIEATASHPLRLSGVSS